MIAVPAVAVKILLRKPINPLDGIVNSRCCKSPLGSITNRSPFRKETKLIAFEATSSGTSIDKVSYGSDFTPSISFMIT